MNSYQPKKRSAQRGSRQQLSPHSAANLARPFSIISRIPKIIRQAGFGLVLILISNALTHGLINTDVFLASANFRSKPKLYLLEEASQYIYETEVFEKKVREISQKLEIEPEWLMAVMYSESKFDASVLNYQGSGAVGLIQFMPKTAAELNISVERLKAMGAIQQLTYVYRYLMMIKIKHGDYQNLTDLYLGILCPDALGQDYCYILYAKPSIAYRQNKVLDENQDGSVSVSDIDRRMQRMFPTAYWLGSEDVADVD